MDPSVTTNSPDKVKVYLKKVIFLLIFFLYYLLQKKENDVISADKSSPDPGTDVHVTVVPSDNTDHVPTIIIDSLSKNNDLTVTPAFPNFPTDEEVVITPEAVVFYQPADNVSEQENNTISIPTTTSRPSQQSSQLLDELKYLLKPTNSLARTDAIVQASVRF